MIHLTVGAQRQQLVFSQRDVVLPRGGATLGIEAGGKRRVLEVIFVVLALAGAQFYLPIIKRRETQIGAHHLLHEISIVLEATIVLCISLCAEQMQANVGIVVEALL